MAMLIISADGGDVTVGPETLGRLAALGVTSVSVLRDGEELALVLEGWAFEPQASAHAAMSALNASSSGARLFHAIAQMNVSAAPKETSVRPTSSDTSMFTSRRRGRDARQQG